MDNLEIARLTGQALAMVSQTYFFELAHPAFPSENMLGNCRVVGFAIDETSSLELLLLQAGEENPDYYPMSQLTISAALQQAA